MNEKTSRGALYYDNPEVDTAGIDADESLAFDAFRDSFTGEQMGTLRVQRVPTEQLKAGQARQSIKGTFLFSCAIDQYTYDELLTYLRDSYGTGTYRLLGIRSGAKGVAFNRLVEVERDHSAINRGNGGPGVGANLAGAPGTEYGAIVGQFSEILRANNENLVKIFQSHMAAPAQLPAPDPMNGMESLMKMMAMLKEVIGVAPKPPDIFGELEKVQRLGELLGLRRGDGEETGMSVFSNLIDKFGPAILDAVKSNQANHAGAGAGSAPALPRPPGVMRPPGVPRQGPGQGPGPAPAPEPAPAQLFDPATLSPDESALRATVLQLLPFAKAGAPAGLIAETVIDRATDEQLDALEETLSDPDSVRGLCRVAPEIRPYLAWFAEVRAGVLHEISLLDDGGTAVFDDNSAATAVGNSDAIGGTVDNGGEPSG